MADDVTSNLLQHEAEMMAFIEGLSFLSPGRDQSLGRDVAVAVAEGIQRRTVGEQQDATGGPLKANAPAYAARKLKNHGVAKVAVLTGQTMSQQSLLGKVEITADEVKMIYGTGQRPTSYSTHGEIKGDEPTDTQKAGYLTEQGRPFYSIDETIGGDVREVTGEGLSAYIRERG